MSRKNRVLVGMSGGVDSSVAAALLKEQGYDVIGITMSVWEPEEEGQATRTNSCCGISEVDDARRVAGTLGFPHYVLNFRKVFQEKVIDPFLDAYGVGETPNPCVNCNKYIKFDYLMAKADELDAGYVATGHYARIEREAGGGRYLLRKGRDSRKDQSYVLYPFRQEALARTLMPLGNFTKEETRAKAEELKLATAGKPESQDICFVQGKNYIDFVQKKRRDLHPGNIVDLEGKVLGTHPGIEFFTVGQRKGIGVAQPEPLYVLAIDPKASAITVGPKEVLYKKTVFVRDANWILFNELKNSVEVHAKIRYQAEDAKATIFPPNGHPHFRVEFEKPQCAPTPGQSIVFYDGDCVVGGGIIDSSS